MTNDAVDGACEKAREQGLTPITAVDDLSVNAVGRWVDIFAKCLARSAMRNSISVVGGEMSQMADTYARGYVGIWVSVVSL